MIEVDVGRKYTTRSGLKVIKLRFDDCPDDYTFPLIGRIRTSTGEQRACWTKTGSYLGTDDGGKGNAFDLIPVVSKKKSPKKKPKPKRKLITGWLNIYKDDLVGGCYHSTRKEARGISGKGAIARIKIQFYEGQGI